MFAKLVSIRCQTYKELRALLFKTCPFVNGCLFPVGGLCNDKNHYLYFLNALAQGPLNGCRLHPNNAWGDFFTCWCVFYI